MVPHNQYRREAIQAIEFAERIDPKWTPRIIALTCLLYLFVVINPAFASGTVEIEIGSASPGDDYVCWAPIEARIRLTEPQAQSKTVVLATTLADVARGSGELAFVDASPGGLEASQVDPRKVAKQQYRDQY